MVKVIVNGLRPEEHMFQESLIAEGTALAEKLEKTVGFTPEDELHIHIKSSVEGKKKRFEVSVRMSVNGKVYATHDLNMDENRNVWDLHLAVKQALEELKKVVEKNAKPYKVKGLSEDEVLEKRGREL